MELTKTEFEIIEGKFHDGLGTYAEIRVANDLIKGANIDQRLYDESYCIQKMNNAIHEMPHNHPARRIFLSEINCIEHGAKESATTLLSRNTSELPIKVLHTPNDFSGARAADITLVYKNTPNVSISIKTDKSGKIAIADGQTPLIFEKWANRFFLVEQMEFDNLIQKLGFASLNHLKSHYLHVALLVANILINKLGLVHCEINDFSRAKPTNIDAVRYLLKQLQYFKRGSDGSNVLIIDRKTGGVKWESLLDSINIDTITPANISLLPSRPRYGRPVGSEFGLKVDSQTIVSFQIKHKRGSARETSRRNEFSDITTRLRI